MKILRYSIFLLMPLILTSCWDKVELEERDYVISIGIDLEDDIYHFTYNLPNLPAVTGQGEGEQNFTKIVEASSLYEANRIFGSRSRKKLNFDHTKVLILGEDLLSNKIYFQKILDEFERNADFARTVMVLAVEDKAEEIIEMELDEETEMGLHLTGLYQNNKYDVLKTTEITLGDLINNIHENKGNVIVPKVVIEEDEPMIDGIGIIIDYEIKDWLGREDVDKISWVTGDGKGTNVTTSFVENEEITVEITKMETKLEFEEKNNQVLIKVNIICDGDVTAYTLNPEHSLFEEDNLEKLEEQINGILKAETKMFIEEIQTEYEVDVFNMLEKLAIQDRKLWIKWNENWDEIFSQADIEVDAEIQIRRIGVAK
ncbi:Ger(x)C family germination protein [Natranaerovirga hydrolytica]|uniref:Ger(X)C family germination protein n=1 Tax=Natranaerovirga hydrolytica TaxID=680378 RepID=A0A4R1MMG1_9FIRM|nr:Ger(x)C family spore germination protein [Natranaerovirga hydrolytica]TCK93290.1 Ger(x)C family germination protein [Natranaerovirga hydrolytica]